jgi:hypothetical protein
MSCFTRHKNDPRSPPFRVLALSKLLDCWVPKIRIAIAWLLRYWLFGYSSGHRPRLRMSVIHTDGPRPSCFKVIRHHIDLFPKNLPVLQSIRSDFCPSCVHRPKQVKAAFHFRHLLKLPLLVVRASCHCRNHKASLPIVSSPISTR